MEKLKEETDQHPAFADFEDEASLPTEGLSTGPVSSVGTPLASGTGSINVNSQANGASHEAGPSANASKLKLTFKGGQFNSGGGEGSGSAGGSINGGGE